MSHKKKSAPPSKKKQSPPKALAKKKPKGKMPNLGMPGLGGTTGAPAGF